MGVSVTRPDVRWAIGLHATGNVETAKTTGLHPLYTTNDPAISVGQNIVETSPLYSEAYESTSHVKVGRRTPSISGLEFPANAYSLTHILPTLFQGGADSTGVKTFSTSDCKLFSIDSGDTAALPDAGTDYPNVVTLHRLFSAADSTNEDHSLAGAVCSSITISGDVGGFVMASADFIGLTHSWAGTVTAPAAALTTYGVAWPFVDFDSAINDIQLGGISLTARSFSITISNGATASSWNSKDPQVIGFAPKISVTGEVVVQLDAQTAATTPAAQKVLTDLKAGTDLIFQVMVPAAGTTSAAGNWYIKSNVMYTGDPEPGEGETAYDLRIPFRGVHDGANDAIQIVLKSATGWT